jgi:hypothetical protein
MKNTIAFTYNPYLYFESYKNVLKNLRKHYEDSDVFIYFDSNRDDIEKYKSIANDYNCFFIVRDGVMGYMNRNDSNDINLPKMIEWTERLKNTCENTNADWILLLEDDVIVKRKALEFPKVECGTNREFFRTGGGSIIKREVLLNSIKNTDIPTTIKTIPNTAWAGDLLLEHIFRNNNVKYEKWKELAEPGYYDNIDHAIYHGYKDLHKLDNMKDVVIGCITNYTFENIKLFVNSIDRSGFNGHKVMIVYNVPFSTVYELKKRGWNVIGFNRDEINQRYTYRDNFIVTVDRHLHYYLALNQLAEETPEGLRYVLALDPKDVVFQYNPSEWLEKNLGDYKINAGRESVKYKDEVWGRGNMIESFGEVVYDRCKENITVNAGTISGDWKTMSELFLNVYLMCQGSPSATPDQAAVNVALSFSPYKELTRFTNSEEGWAAQCGTTVDQRMVSQYGDNLLEPSPIMDGDIVKTSTGIPFAMVHQYDRIPEWNKIITKKYQ